MKEKQSKAQRDAEELRRRNETEVREAMRELVASLQAELAKYKKALEILTDCISGHCNKGYCPLHCDGKPECSQRLNDWALSEAEKGRDEVG